MGLSPLYRPSEEGDKLVRVRAQRQAHSAVTRYKVLDSGSGCSLVELQPITGTDFPLERMNCTEMCFVMCLFDANLLLGGELSCYSCKKLAVVMVLASTTASDVR